MLNQDVLASAEGIPSSPSGRLRGLLQDRVLVATVAGALVLLASLANYLTFNNYPLLRLEVALVAVILVAVAAAVGIVYALSGSVVRTLLDILLAIAALDLNFNGIGVPLAACVGALVLNRFLVPMLGIIAAFVLVSQVGATAMGGGHAEARATDSAGSSAGAPALLHILLDEHIGPEGLPADLPAAMEAKEKLIEFYTGHGFRLFGGAYSHFLHTVNAVPDILNFGSQTAEPAGGQKGVVVAENAYFARLADLGYNLRVYQTDFIDLCSHGKLRNCSTLRAADIQALATSPLSEKDKANFILFGFLSLSGAAVSYDLGALLAAREGIRLPRLRLEERRATGPLSALSAFDRLIDDLRTAKPGQAYFAHLLFPHYPYVTEADCRLKDPSDWHMRRSRADWETRQRAYFDQIGCAARKMEAAVEALSASPAGGNFIVVVHGDHGSRITTKDPVVENLGEFSDADLVTGHSTLFAVRAPTIPPGYSTERVPAAGLLGALASSSFRSADLQLGPDFVPTVSLENFSWKPIQQHALPPSWTAR